ncbi:glycosyltransferase family 2 protein [Legionella cardiaca]|uniref:Glycosyltransferase family 2 protein n=1 Tax=Legionella cardiaca TaxID=1071983 RepID=A0ABY8AVR9_9GAMM|nr:glycosyltransferase family 2 protein [Legionella cardiaca]WED43521.1 glycosyltransferase family 2 protein [Legionella cardiaca]
MSDFFYQIYAYLMNVFSSGNLWFFIAFFFPFVILLELPFYLITLVYVIRGWLRIHFEREIPSASHPLVSVVITAYSESKEELEISLRSVVEQIYPGKIELLFVIDDAIKNHKTVLSMKQLAYKYRAIQNCLIRIIEKKTRGGHASSMNLGLKMARGDILVMIDADTSIDNLSLRKIVKHFIDPNVIAVSGAIRVRNWYENFLTKLQSLEYMLGIQLGRFGLTEINITNNISGAFGIFRTGFLRQMGGWMSGTAEDLDLTLRIHAYCRRYPQFKIVNEPEAVAWTVAPTTLRRLLKQRMRWDGDLYYIYIRRHWRMFSSKIMGGKKMFLFSWYALYYQLLLPFLILLYYVYLLIRFDLPTMIAISILVYTYYFLATLFLYIIFLLLVSERPKNDLKLVGWVIVTPIYQQFIRAMTAVFIMNEILFKGHQDTTMAPWWVIRKSK